MSGTYGGASSGTWSVYGRRGQYGSPQRGIAMQTYKSLKQSYDSLFYLQLFSTWKEALGLLLGPWSWYTKSLGNGSLASNPVIFWSSNHKATGVPGIPLLLEMLCTRSGLSRFGRLNDLQKKKKKKERGFLSTASLSLLQPCTCGIMMSFWITEEDTVNQLTDGELTEAWFTRCAAVTSWRCPAAL